MRRILPIDFVYPRPAAFLLSPSVERSDARENGKRRCRIRRLTAQKRVGKIQSEFLQEHHLHN